MFQKKYSLPIRMVHWLTAVLVIGVLIGGFVMTSKTVTFGTKSMIYPLHKKVGFTILIISIARIFMRAFSRPVKPLAGLNKIEAFLSKFAHYALYVMLFVMPISGYVMSSRIVYFFDIEIRPIFKFSKKVMKMSHDLHEFLAIPFAILIVFHVLGFVKHLVIDRKNLLKRII